jgi:hypothetical protein
MEDPKPPFLLCCLIALATVGGVGALIISQNDRDEREMTAAVSASAEDLSKIIQLKKIYSAPPEPEDVSKYKERDEQKDNSRGPANR